MEEKTLPIHRSEKPVKNIEFISGNKLFFFPRHLANDNDPNTGKDIILIMVNGKKFIIPVGEEVVIDYQAFCILKDNYIITAEHTYEINGEFDPLGYGAT